MTNEYMDLTLYPMKAFYFELATEETNYPHMIEVMIEYERFAMDASTYRGMAWLKCPDVVPNVRNLAAIVEVTASCIPANREDLEADLTQAVLSCKEFAATLAEYISVLKKQSDH